MDAHVKLRGWFEQFIDKTDMKGIQLAGER